jgi:addiction module RelE/StbE family toxin
VKLEWSRFALADRDEIFDYIEADNPRAAVTVDQLIVAGVQRLTQFPDAGRIGRTPGTRELVINRTPYIAVYRVTVGVRILRILHGSRRWPDDMPD